MSIIEKLTEGVVRRNVQKEGQTLLNKWDKTGLLEGIEDDQRRQTMACLLENQAKELLREASSMAAGDVEGFAAVAFPIVRRVFGGLIANELVSVQPMSLPSGLIFFLDFTFNSHRGPAEANASIYGGNVVGNQVTGGVDLGGRYAEDSFYSLNNGYASPTGSATVVPIMMSSGTFGGSGVENVVGGWGNANPADSGGGGIDSQEAFDRLCRYDPAFVSGTTTVAFARLRVSELVTAQGNTYNKEDLITISGSFNVVGTEFPVRRLNALSGTNGGFHTPGEGISHVTIALASLDGTRTAAQLSTVMSASTPVHFTLVDNWTGSGAALGGVVGTQLWGLENNISIPEIDIKVDAVSITADTKKLKAKWTPELQQDINAYHNLDAEVELTSILSEQIALEIDQEILNDLIVQASAGTYYWSRKPGKFVNRTKGGTINQTLYPDFTGTVSEWYETLLETVNDVSAVIHRKTLRGGANFLVTSPEIANIMEFTSGFRADTTADENKGAAGAVKVGQISKKWDIYVDPYFPRNLVLVGRKGNSFLESGYVYAPYVPLQVTPTIFGPEDFVPRKGVMTRYGKKMVRPDMYGLVVVEDLLG